jgi:pimeloyl-ACP methyl ester carboxylesterase
MANRKEQLHGSRAANRPVPPSLRVMRFLFARVGALFPRLLGRWAFKLWFRTRRFPESAAGRLAAREAEREILLVNNMPVAIYRWGSEGPRVLFVHGWSGRGSQVAAFVAPLLAAGYQVLALDMPGHGETPGSSTNVFECAGVIRELDVKYGPLHAAITHSFGGMVLGYALNEGVLLDRAVIISAPSDVDFLLESFAHTLSMHPAVVDDLWRRLELRFGDEYSEMISPVNVIGNLDVPALVVHDEQDTSVPWQQGQRIAATWPNALFLKTTGLGHGRILRDDEVISTAVRFISQ